MRWGVFNLNCPQPRQCCTVVATRVYCRFCWGSLSSGWTLRMGTLPGVACHIAFPPIGLSEVNRNGGLLRILGQWLLSLFFRTNAGGCGYAYQHNSRF